jgi:hypothetical protein
MTEVDKEQMGYENYAEDKAYEFGLVNVYAYHCRRCNYTWLPKDFDFNWREPFKGEMSKWLYWGQDLFFREPPKVCARCKSKSWRKVFPQRKLKLHPIFKGEDWIDEDKINDVGSGLNRPWINSVARLRALTRQGKLTPKDIIQL